MGTQAEARLREVIAAIAAKATKYRDRGIGEQNTKATMIEPILEALGWDIRDPDEVHREFRPTGKDCPVDYALKLIRKPRLFLEAKGLGETLADRKWIAQVLGYAIVAGVEWCVLSDGDEYRFYNATAPVDAEEKMFCRIRLSEGAIDAAVKTLNLISRGNMEENLLDVLWGAHFVDRRVKAALLELLSPADRSLARLVRRKVPALAPKDIAESLRRLDIRIDSPATVTAGAMRSPNSPAAAPAKTRRKQKEKVTYKVSLADLIACGLLRTPLQLYRRYKGHDMEATLHPDGTVEFQGGRYNTCSTAAEIARGTITGHRMNTNGWSFWQYRGDNNRWTELDVPRQEYLKRQSPQEGN